MTIFAALYLGLLELSTITKSVSCLAVNSLYLGLLELSTITHTQDIRRT